MREIYSNMCVEAIKSGSPDEKGLKQFTSAITKLFKERMLELIPPGRISTDRMGYTSSKDDGFNECIAELRNAINTEGERNV
jgi:hypothetical protein